MPPLPLYLRFLSLFSLFLTVFSVTAHAENDLSVGVEGFKDMYKETGQFYDLSSSSPTTPAGKFDVKAHTDSGSVTATDTYIDDGDFIAIDGRYSKGEAHFKADQGVVEQPQMETDVRLRAGGVWESWHGILMPYIGVGAHWYFDNGKGRIATLGGVPSAISFDRRTSQLYAPIGATFHYNDGDLIWSPTLEVDPLLYGRMQSRLSFPTDGQLPNTTNVQHLGFGSRGELTVGQKYEYFGWEAGPFFRYWNIQRSDPLQKTVVNGQSFGVGFEPHNDRLQYGLGMRVNF